MGLSIACDGVDEWMNTHRCLVREKGAEGRKPRHRTSVGTAELSRGSIGRGVGRGKQRVF